MNKPSRLSWFALYVDSFLEDGRMQTLTNKEKSAWLMMLVKAFRNNAIIITDPHIIAEQTGLSRKEAKVLIGKLWTNQLVTETDPPRVYQAISQKLKAEHERAAHSYEAKSNAGKVSASKNGGLNNLKSS